MELVEVKGRDSYMLEKGRKNKHCPDGGVAYLAQQTALFVHCTSAALVC